MVFLRCFTGLVVQMETPLLVAARRGATASVRWLLERDARMDVMDRAASKIIDSKNLLTMQTSYSRSADTLFVSSRQCLMATCRFPASTVLHTCHRHPVLTGKMRKHASKEQATQKETEPTTTLTQEIPFFCYSLPPSSDVPRSCTRSCPRAK